jgi:hypothetical protein
MKLLAPIALTALAVTTFVTSALADGDPASDYLVLQNVFVPRPPPARSARSDLQLAVNSVYARGFRIKVAVVATRYDLGSIPSLHNRPTQYAHFLGQELRPYYAGPLLIVMPAGFGIYDAGRTTSAEAIVLARRRVTGTSATALTSSAATAVRALRDARSLRSKDILAPLIAPLTQKLVRGTKAQLRYQVSDDSGRASITLEIRGPAATVATLHMPLRPVDGRRVYSIAWAVPHDLPRDGVRLCASAEDPAGNRAPRSAISSSSTDMAQAPSRRPC